MSKDDLTPNTNELLQDILNKLRIKCSYCKEKRLTRGDFDTHYRETCQEVAVQCSSANDKCPWKGPRRELQKHLEKCFFYLFRDQIAESYTAQQQMNDKIEQLAAENARQNGVIIEQQKQCQYVQNLLENFQASIAQILNCIEQTSGIVDQQKYENRPAEFYCGSTPEIQNNQKNPNHSSINIDSSLASETVGKKLALISTQINDDFDEQHLRDDRCPSQNQRVNSGRFVSPVCAHIDVARETNPGEPIIELPHTNQNSRASVVHDIHKTTSPSEARIRPFVNPDIQPAVLLDRQQPMLHLTVQGNSHCGNVNINIGENTNAGGGIDHGSTIGHKYPDTNTTGGNGQTVNRNLARLGNRSLPAIPRNNFGIAEHGSDGDSEASDYPRSANDLSDRSSINRHTVNPYV
ncbi:unnamed protein product [Adineta ricciae]|uniref:TRAF-type domain-containing protein n=1 Tax=Adineta ricciae TaxID=249248 RepID=A0A814NC83_ADIRI|nr:unnamed protein product [Adineta ricciae]CAF1412483.1 unnamed protein product [Adineta ricciae]